jgi:hypothetical protein
MNAKWKKALIVSLAGIAVLTTMNLFASIQQYRVGSAWLKLYSLPPASNRVEDQQNIDSIRQGQDITMGRIESESITIVLVLFGMWCVPRALNEAKPVQKK